MQFKFQFENMVPGEYRITFRADGYEPLENVPVTLIPNQNNRISAALEPDNPLPVLRAVGRNNTVQALPESGILPEDAPVVKVSTTADKRGIISTVTLSSPGCADFVCTPGFNIYDADVFGVDMGDGEYTFGMSLQVNGTMGGEENYIFKIVGNEFRILKYFKIGGNRSDNIIVTAKFSTSNKFSGTIAPTGTKFTAYSHFDSSEQKGKEVWENGTGVLELEENEDGTYNMIFRTIERCLYNANGVGSSYTRYVMKDGEAVIESQWYKGSREWQK